MSNDRLDELFQTYDTYVCLFSDRLLPNVIPALQAKRCSFHSGDLILMKKTP